MKKTSTAYVDPPGMHRHKCDNCGCIWQHETARFPPKRSHDCPDCGEWQGWKYTGPSAPTHVNANPEE